MAERISLRHLFLRYGLKDEVAGVEGRTGAGSAEAVGLEVSALVEIP